MQPHKFLCNNGAHTVTILPAPNEINEDIEQLFFSKFCNYS